MFPDYLSVSCDYDNIDVKAFLDDNFTLPCNCTGSPFVDKDHNHIITRNLKIINKNKSRKLFSKVSRVP